MAMGPGCEADEVKERIGICNTTPSEYFASAVDCRTLYFFGLMVPMNARACDHGVSSADRAMHSWRGVSRDFGHLSKED